MSCIRLDGQVKQTESLDWPKVYMSLAKNLVGGGRIGVKFFSYLLKSQESQEYHFLAKKVKIFFKNSEKFNGWKGDTFSNPPQPPKLIDVMAYKHEIK